MQSEVETQGYLLLDIAKGSTEQKSCVIELHTDVSESIKDMHL